MKDEFYIGWEAKAAPGIRNATRKSIIVILVLALVVPALLALAQGMIGVSVFEWGTTKSFSGVLRAKPYPHLLVARPGNANGLEYFSSYHLVAPWKFGLAREWVDPLDGRSVSLEGSLIYRGNQTMIEVQPDTLKPIDQVSVPTLPEVVALGQETFVGEIVDSKCFLGVMNPGQLTPHRACAIRCISGGIPPVLLVRQEDGTAVYLLLVSAGGMPVNKDVLDLVAEPIEITGDLERQGNLLILRADPSTYRRVP